MRIFAALILIFCLFSVVRAADSENAVFVDENFKSARQALLDQDYVEAVKSLNIVQERYPDNPAVLNHLAYSYLKLRMYEDAAATYKRCIRLASKSSTSSTKDIAKMYTNLGIAYSQQNKNSEASKVYQKAVELMPEYAKAWQNLGKTYLKLGEEGHAMEAYQRAVEIDPKLPQIWSYLGEAYLKKGDTQQSLQAYQKAVQLNPDDTKAWQALGEIYLKLKRHQEANDAFEKASKFNSKNLLVWGNQKNAEKESPRIEPYLKALQLKPQEVSSWQNLAQAYMKEGRADRAIAVYSRALWLWGGDLEDEENELIPKNRQEIFTLLNDLGSAYFASGKFKESIETWRLSLQILTNNGKNKEAAGQGVQERIWFKMAVAYEKQQQFSKAIDAYEKITQKNPDYIDAWKRLAELYKQTDDKEAAKKAYRKYKKLMKKQ